MNTHEYRQGFANTARVSWSLVLYALIQGAALGVEPVVHDYASAVVPVLRSHCYACHNADKAKGGVDLASLAQDEDIAKADTALWEQVADAVEFGEMPPPKSKSLDAAQRRLLLAYANTVKQEKLDYIKDVKPLLDKYCVECHSKSRGKRVSGAFARKVDFDHAETLDGRNRWMGWHFVVNQVKRQSMPPPKGKYRKMRPSAAEYKIIESWSRQQHQYQLKHYDCSDFGIRDYRWERSQAKFIWSRRRTIAEYAHAVDDLLGAEVIDWSLLPAEGGARYVKNSKGMYMSSAHLEKFLSAVDKATKAVMNSTDPRIQKAREILLLNFNSDHPEEGFRLVLKPLLRRAFSREIDAHVLERYAAVGDKALKRGKPAAEAMRLAISGVLLAPSFLYLRDDEGGRKGQMSMPSYSRAARIAAFLWSSVPDHELLDCAKAGKLNGEGARAQIRRMIKDPRSRRLARHFSKRWLEIGGLGTEQEPDAKTFPDYDADLNTALVQEVVATFTHWFQTDAHLDLLIDADHIFVNQRLAEHYGLSGISGATFRLVPRPGPHRGGVLGMAAPLTATSAPDRTNVVLRGKWILENLLGEHVPEPPPDAGNLPAANLNGKVLTLRQRMELHSTNPTCMACHQKLDPLGFALEGFDATGRWLKGRKGIVIDDRGRMSNGRQIDGILGLKEMLKERKHDVFRSVSSKLMRFAIGRPFRLYDNCSLNAMLADCQANGWTWHRVLENIIMSDSFNKRHYDARFSPGLVVVKPKQVKH